MKIAITMAKVNIWAFERTRARLLVPKRTISIWSAISFLSIPNIRATTVIAGSPRTPTMNGSAGSTSRCSIPSAMRISSAMLPIRSRGNAIVRNSFTRMYVFPAVCLSVGLRRSGISSNSPVGSNFMTLCSTSPSTRSSASMIPNSSSAHSAPAWFPTVPTMIAVWAEHGTEMEIKVASINRSLFDPIALVARIAGTLHP